MAVACLGCSTRPAPAPPALLIRDVTILSMDDEAPRPGSVLVRGERIEYVGPTASLPPVANAQIVDGNGRFLIPGLIDMHTHVSKTRGSSLLLLVAAGVTTVRDLGGITRSCWLGVARSMREHGSALGC
jgi:predicted amidohydrolase YtcJ